MFNKKLLAIVNLSGLFSTLLSGLLYGLLVVSVSYAHEKKHEAPQAKQNIHWAAPETEQARPSPVPMSQVSVVRGKALFETYCANCHGIEADGKGPDARGMNPLPTNLRQMAGHHSNGDLAWKIETGRGPMPGWKKVLSEQEIWDLVNFIQHLEN